MLRKIVIFNTIFLCSFVLAAQNDKVVLNRVVGTVGGELLLQSEIDEQYSYLLERNKGKLPENAKCLITDQIINQKLLVNQAKLDSVKVTEEEVDNQVSSKMDNILAYMNNDINQLESFYGLSLQQLKEQVKEEQKNQMLFQRMQAKIMGDVTVTPSEVKAYFNAIPKDSIPYYSSEVELGEIVYKPKINEQQKRLAREKLEDIRRQIVDSGMDFGKAAEKFSDDPGSARVGGDLGWAKRGKFVQAFEAAAYKLEKNEYSPIVETEFGYHLIQLLERRGNSIHARHILIHPQITEEDIELAKFKMDSISHRLNQDSLDFSLAVKQYSEKQAQSYNSDGRMFNPVSNNSFFEMADIDPEIFFSIDTLKVGKCTAAIKFSSPGEETYYRIIKLFSRTAPHKASLKTDYQRLQNAAIEQKKSGIINKWVENVAKKTHIEIVPEVLAECENLKKWQRTPK